MLAPGIARLHLALGPRATRPRGCDGDPISGLDPGELWTRFADGLRQVACRLCGLAGVEHFALPEQQSVRSAAARLSRT